MSILRSGPASPEKEAHRDRLPCPPVGSGRGIPWIRPESEHHRAFGEHDLERSGTGLGVTGAVLVEAARGDAGETLALRDTRLRRPDLVVGYVANLHVHGEGGPTPFLGLLHELGDLRPNGMRLGGTSWTDTPSRPVRWSPCWRKRAWCSNSTCISRR